MNVVIKRRIANLIFVCIVPFTLSACSMIQYAKGENEDRNIQVEAGKNLLVKSNVDGIVNKKMHNHGFYLLIENAIEFQRVSYYDFYTLDSTTLKIKVSRKLYNSADIGDSVKADGNILALFTDHSKLSLLSEEYGKWYP